jgi:hypothetical protein
MFLPKSDCGTGVKATRLSFAKAEVVDANAISRLNIIDVNFITFLLKAL